tara:strand:- start:841 stop:1665 length:825 start_codon:yes stop_codon:yes gene_type:complete
MNTAIVDIGSNAIKYKIFNNNFELQNYYRHPLRLGRDVFLNGELSKDTEKQLIELLLNYQKIFREKKITDIHYIATSALRDSKNVDILKEKLANNNIELKIISGDTEASLLSEFNKRKMNTAVIDIGGGSVEICVNLNNKLSYRSFQLGAVRLLNFTSEQKQEAYGELVNWLKGFKGINHLYGLGGNLRALMQVNSLDGTLETEKFSMYTKKYLSISDEDLILKFNIPKDRIDIIPEAIKIYQLIIDSLNSGKIENSFWSISDGLVRKIVTNQL